MKTQLIYKVSDGSYGRGTSFTSKENLIKYLEYYHTDGIEIEEAAKEVIFSQIDAGGAVMFNELRVEGILAINHPHYRNKK